MDDDPNPKHVSASDEKARQGEMGVQTRTHRITKAHVHWDVMS
jgi:hypothetical protein